MCVPGELVSLCPHCTFMENRATQVLLISVCLACGTGTVWNRCAIQACWMDTWTEAERCGFMSCITTALQDTYYYSHGAEEQIWGSPRREPAYSHSLAQAMKQQAGQSHQGGSSCFEGAQPFTDSTVRAARNPPTTEKHANRLTVFIGQTGKS